MKKSIKKIGVYLLLVNLLFIFMGSCDDDLPGFTISNCQNPEHLGISSTDSISPYEGNFIWSSVADVDSFCFSFTWNSELYVEDSIVSDTLFPFNYGFEPGDTLILCVSSYCDSICVDPPREDTIIFSNGLAEDDIVFFVPPQGAVADSMCTTTLTCDVVNFSGSLVNYKGKNIHIGNFYTNYYYWVDPLCNRLQNNGDDLLNAMQSSLHGWRTSGSIPCN